MGLKNTLKHRRRNIRVERIRAVIFDLDGLMVHSETFSMKAWQQLLGAFGYSLRDEDYRELIGIDEDTTITRLRQGRELPLSSEEILDLHNRYWMEIAVEEVQPAHGLLDLIEAIRARGLKMGVASNSRSDYVHLVLDTIGLKGYFGCVVTSDDVERGKPAPDVYKEAADRLRVKPGECLALEDSPAGLQSALNAGMRCVVVPNLDLLHVSYHGAFLRFPTLTALQAELERVLS
jgi:HAD superfamily hydrolase (TIGR01509 family)